MLNRRYLTAAVATLLLPAAAAAQDPYEMDDDTWISLDGTVEAVSADAFTLDYGDGLVTVEMDDWDDDADGYKVVVGDEVSVYGAVDDGLFEATTIEASSVYVDGLNAYFYASSADEEDFDEFVSIYTPLQPASALVQGTVVGTHDDHFTISTGEGLLRVGLSDLGYDPLDDRGWQKLEIGDRVSVRGTVDAGFFTDRELDAESIVTLFDESSM
ncbi:MAG: DUF5666 domain-containing protein [Longimicrobiales bacterium]